MYIFDDFCHFLRPLEHWSSGPNHSHGQTQTLNLARSDMGTGRAWGGGTGLKPAAKTTF